MEKIKSDGTQEERVLKCLQEAKGNWVNGQYFLHTLFLSQFHRALWNLKNHRERYNYEGDIEASTDKKLLVHGFKSYRLIKTAQNNVIKENVSNLFSDLPTFIVVKDGRKKRNMSAEERVPEKSEQNYTGHCLSLKCIGSPYLLECECDCANCMKYKRK